MWQNKSNRSTKSLFAVSLASFTTNVSADDGSSDGAQGMTCEKKKNEKFGCLL